MRMFYFSLCLFLSSCNTITLPRGPVKAPDSSLFPTVTHGYVKPITVNYDTRNSNDATERQINSILRGGLKGKACLFIKYGKAFNVDPLFGGAVAMNESGGSSRISRSKNNYFGLMGKRGPMSFASTEECIAFFFRKIHEKYHGKKLYTIAQIQPVYCPSPKIWKNNVVKIANRAK